MSDFDTKMTEIDLKLQIHALKQENADIQMSLRNWIDKCAAQAIRLGDLERENAALRADKERLDLLLTNKHCKLSFCWEWLHWTPQQVRCALDAERVKRKEAKPCGCTNGIIRAVGRDNEEIIEDCPHCSARKEAQP